jgi:RNA polymerase sigma-70 factor, ECF subfamily
MISNAFANFWRIEFVRSSRCGVIIIGDDDRCGQNVLACPAQSNLGEPASCFWRIGRLLADLTLSTDTESSETDAELIVRLARGDQTAFTALVRRWEGPLVRIAYRITGDLAEAEDVRQRVLLKVLSAPDTVREPERFAAWIHRAAVNASLSALRRRKRRDGFIIRHQKHAATLDESHPSARLIADDQTRLLADAMLRLEPEVRALLALRFDLDLTFQAIADALGEPASTVKSRLARAIGRLRTVLAEHDEWNQNEARS